MSLKLGFGTKPSIECNSTLWFTNVALEHIRVETVEVIVGE
jgi:hypothetical protein